MANAKARNLRKNMTEAERRLWQQLRALKSDGFHFRKQAPIGSFIADFCCHGVKLVIEVDGGQHGLVSGIQSDQERTAWLTARGYRVLRFWNSDALSNIEGVMTQIISSLNPHPNPSPQGGGAFEVSAH